MKKVIRNTFNWLGARCTEWLAWVEEFDRKQKVTDTLPAENSVTLRIVATLMASLVITLACYYVNASLLQTLVYLIIALFGSYIAYLCRPHRSTLVSWTSIVGVVIVVGFFIQEVLFQFYLGRLDLLMPFILVVTGLQALHMFDLRTRGDINTSGVIGLGCLAAAALVGQDIGYGVGVLMYVVLGAVMLYLECIEPEAGGPGTAVSNKDLLLLGGTARSRRSSAGSAVLITSTLPILALIVFFNIPRIESFVDRLVTVLAGMTTSIGVTVTPQSGSGTSYGGERRVRGGGGSLPKLTPEQARKHTSKEQSPAGWKGKEGKASAGKNGSTKSQTTASKTHGKFEEKNGEDTAFAKYSLADKATEEEMTLNYAGKSAVASENPLLMVTRCQREVFLRRLSFDTFDGSNWKVSPKDNKEQSFQCNPDVYTNLMRKPPQTQDIPGLDLTQEVEAIANLGHIVPAAWIPKMIAYPAEKIFFDDSATIRVKDGTLPGAKYRVVSRMPIYNLEVMRRTEIKPEEADKVRSSFKRYLQIPASQGSQVALLARGLTANTNSWFGQAETICDYLRHNFDYSIDAPRAEKSANLVNYFLFNTRKGDCSHFASALVILCRSLGIPARCVGGFAPGERNYITGQIEVHAVQAHAWAEVYLPNFGWVPFDPVPGGYMPALKPEQGILAQLLKSDQAQALTGMFASMVRAHTNHLGQSEEKNVSGGGGDASASGKGLSKSSGPSGGTQMAGGSFTQAGQVVSLSPAVKTGKTREVSRASGWNLKIAGSPPKIPGLHRSPFQMSLKDLFHLPRLTWFLENSTELLAALFGGLILSFLGYRWALLKGRAKRFEEIPLKLSTQAFLRVIEDLSQINFERDMGETPQEIVNRVTKLIGEMEKANGLTELPLMLADFMDKYAANRFVETELPELRAEVDEIGNKIHVLLTSRAK